jgi:hypothetical protein
MHAATTGRTVSHTVRTRATCLHVPNAARVQTTLMLRSDGDPTVSINTPARRILFISHKSELLAACELFAYSSHISGIFLVFFSSVFFKKKTFRMLFFWKYEMHIAAMLKFLGLNCDITLYLFFTQVLFTAVIMPKFVLS